jgi:hypothetical protein
VASILHFINLFFIFILVYIHIAHQVLVWHPQGVDGVAVLVNLIL